MSHPYTNRDASREHALEVRIEPYEADLGLPFLVSVPGSRSYYLDGEPISEEEAQRHVASEAP